MTARVWAGVVVAATAIGGWSTGRVVHGEARAASPSATQDQQNAEAPVDPLHAPFDTLLDLYVRGTGELEAKGLGRGPARAVAHVGTELLIDGLLLDRDAAKQA